MNPFEQIERRLADLEREVFKAKPKPRPWTVGDWAIPDDKSIHREELGTFPRRVTRYYRSSFSRAMCLDFEGAPRGYPTARHIRTDEHGNPDPEQPEE